MNTKNDMLIHWKIEKQLNKYSNSIIKMNSLLNTMFAKRFCLEGNANVADYEQGSSSVNACLCGNYNHVACVLKGKGIR